jgi:DNA-binding transcriptional regulator YhcF (GntR family)
MVNRRSKKRKGETVKSIRPIKRLVKSKSTLERAGVHLRRAKYFEARSDGRLGQVVATRDASMRQLRQELVQAERSEIIEMHKQGDISDAALRAVLHDIDLEEQRGE